ERDSTLKRSSKSSQRRVQGVASNGPGRTGRYTIPWSAWGRRQPGCRRCSGGSGREAPCTGSTRRVGYGNLGKRPRSPWGKGAPRGGPCGGCRRMPSSA
ncbi:unnamed protein product, partial [Discosporangium mesarthrocarpum]